MWYLGLGDREGEDGFAHDLFACHATNRDGVHWEKPDLGLVWYGGDKKNNRVRINGLQESDRVYMAIVLSFAAAGFLDGPFSVSGTHSNKPSKFFKFSVQARNPLTESRKQKTLLPNEESRANKKSLWAVSVYIVRQPPRR